ncbi:MAG: 2-oxoacid:ferredoxin oxidoreductase subunit beta, partial [Spirochaetes bacterium]|nr:2-oxoacid:ferredoxin oxidoreductase subunit beta [Spirochaetota bacterium]
YARRNRLGTGLEIMRFYKENSYITDILEPEDTALLFKGKIAVGKFVDIEKPTFMEMYREYIVQRAENSG